MINCQNNTQTSQNSQTSQTNSTTVVNDQKTALCSQGQFKDNQGNCQKCDSKCNLCFSNSTNCQSCSQNFLLHAQLNKCSDKCDNGWTQIQNKQECQKCQDNGLCQQYNQNSCQCSQCKPQYNLFQNQCVQACPSNTNPVNGQCVANVISVAKECSQGQYKDEKGNCQNCDAKCQSCTNNPTNCQSCKQNFLLHASINKCLDKCDNGWTQIQNKQECQKCQDNGLCQQYNQNSCQCFSCNPQSNLYQSQCVQTCPANTAPLNGKCVVKDCTQGQFKDNGGNCINCDAKCQSCSNNPLNCQTCKQNFYLHPTLNKCSENCDNGYQLVQQQCQKCSDNGLCKNYNPNTCTCSQCNQQSFSFNGQCLQQCPQNTKAVNGNCVAQVCKDQCSENWVTIENGDWGDWLSPQQYDNNQQRYAIGAQLRVEEPQGVLRDDTGANGLKLIYASKTNYNDQVTQTVNEGLWGNWGPVVKCPGQTWIIGGQVRYENKQGAGDDTALNGLKIKCSDGSWQLVHNGHWGNWRNEVSQDSSWKVCGAQSRFEKSQGIGDDTALNGIKFKFCKCTQTCS